VLLIEKTCNYIRVSSPSEIFLTDMSRGMSVRIVFKVENNTHGVKKVAARIIPELKFSLLPN
jgi:hypothetical protein